jgi:MFS family permease
VFGLWTHALFDWSPRDLGVAFATAGCVGALSQLLLTARLVRRFGDRMVLRLGLVCTSLALFIQAFPPSGAAMIAMIGLASFGISMALPTASTLLSREAEPGKAGRLMGATMAAAAVARIVGPLFAGLIYSDISPRAPFLIGSAAVLVTLLLTADPRRRLAALETR